MKHTWKQLFCLVLCFVLVGTLLPVPVGAEAVPAAETVRQGKIWPTGLDWVLDSDGTLTISGEGEMLDLGDCNPIPWVSLRDQIRKVVVEEGVTSLGGNAFADCDNLEEVWLADSVTTIGPRVFYECINLTSIRMPVDLAFVGFNAFYRCIKLRSIDLGNRLISIGYGAFDSCYTLSRVVLPDTLITVGSYAFRACEGLLEIWFMGEMPTFAAGEEFAGVTATVYYPRWSTKWESAKAFLGGHLTWEPHDGSAPGGYEPATSGTCGDDLTWQLSDQGVLTILGTGDMWDYSTLEEPGWRYENVNTLILADGVTSVGAYALYYCDDLSVVIFPESLTRIGECAFSGLENLTSLSLPEGLESIGASAFRGCTGLTSLAIPHSVTEVEDSAFDECYNIISLDLGSSITAIGDHAFSSWVKLEQVTIPESVTSIGEKAFYACQSLKQIVIPDSVTELGQDAFGLCDALESAVVGAGVPYIPMKTFDRCYSLKNVTIRGPISGVYADAFAGCESLSSINLPASVERFVAPFPGCTSLEAIHIDPENPWFCSIDGVVYTRDLTELLCCPAGKAGFFTVPFPVITIADSAFEGCDKITGVDLANVSYIDDYAFSDCTGLVDITLPVSVTSVDSRVFLGCTGLSSIHFQCDIPRMSTDAFEKVCATCYYPKDFEGWQGRDSLNVGGFDGVLTWVPVDTGHIHSFSGESVESGDCQIPDRDVFTCECGVRYENVKTYTVKEHCYSGWWSDGNGETESRYCVICLKTWTRPIGSEDTHPHDYSSRTVDPTCASQGYTLEECWCGASRYTAFQPQLPHSFGTWSDQGDGIGCRVCEGCGLKQYAHSSGTIGSISWTLEGNTLVFSGTGEISAGDEPAPWAASPFTALVIEEGITGIGDRAFAGCPSLTEVSLPGSVTDIAPDAFAGSTNVAWYSVAEGNDTYRAVNGVLYSEDMATLVRFPAARGGQFAVPGTVTALAPGAFENCARLTEILFYHLDTYTTLTTIGERAFAGCAGLTEISLPATLAEVGDKAFYYCRNLGTIHFQGDVPAFGELVFEGMAFLRYTFSRYPNNWYRFADQFNDWTGTMGAYNVRYEEVCSEGLWGHCCDANEVEIVAPTCCTDGYDVWTCIDCGMRYASNAVPSTGEHSYTPVTTEPTCTTPGQTVWTCAGCGDSYTDGQIPALGHEWGQWYVFTEATEEPGEERRDCVRCDAFESRELPPAVHVHDFRTERIVEPTCSDPGYTQVRCECGEVEYRNHIAPLGHVFVDGICQRCGLSNPFADVKDTDYYFMPVLWALEHGITAGTGPDTFAPNAPCTRGQVVTFLWRANGEPEPVSDDNPFSDVAPGDYYYRAVLWAVENGITSGTGNGRFSPNTTCTRAQVVTFLWRALGEPAPAEWDNPFSDVAQGVYYYQPVLWAVENSITSGTSPTAFSPNNPCTRGQVVTFLYRAFHR
ncbi:MAG: leucine-rich repeat protein [Oscillospiraceae bacterium]|nr:leucine-rich repeat protein [Oscillospiraceae bacterium]